MDLLVTTTLPRAQPVRDEALDLAAPLANFFLEQEETYRPLALATQSNPWLPRPSLDEGIDNTSLKFFFLEQEEPARFLALAVQAVLWLPRPALDEGLDTTTLAFFYLTHDEPLFPPQQAQPWLPRPSLDEGIDSTNLDFFYLEQEEPRVAQLVATQSIVCYPQATTDEAIDSTTLANFSLDHQEPWFAQTTAQPWTARPPGDEDPLAVTPSTISVEEEYWFPPPQVAVLWLPRPALDEAIDTTTLANFFLDQQDLPPTPQQSIAWLSRVATDDDGFAALQIVDEDQPAFVGVQTVAWLPRPALDEAIDSTTLANFRIEDELGAALRAMTAYPAPAPVRDEDPLRLPPLPGEDERAWVAQYEANPWLPLAFRDEAIDTTNLVVPVFVRPRKIRLFASRITAFALAAVRGQSTFTLTAKRSVVFTLTASKEDQ